MRVDRIKETIKLLRNASSVLNTFDYSCWGERINSCDTVACAGGLMTLYPPFNARGLYHVYGSFAPMYDTKDQTFYGVTALEVFLELTEEQATTAFCSLHAHLGKSMAAITADDVADYLESLLEEETNEH